MYICFVPQPPPMLVAGYDLGSTGSLSAPPPDIPVAVTTIAPTAAASHGLSEEDARAALLRKCDQEGCCWGKGPATRMKLVKNEGTDSLYLSYKTHCETRDCSRISVPYRGEPIMQAGWGPTPQPWEMRFPDVAPWFQGVRDVEIPFTASIAKCHGCQGYGRVRCRPCGGDGRVTCGSCSGRGYHERQQEGGGLTRTDCSNCTGGQAVCRTCQGTAFVTCPMCQGARCLKHFLNMRIQHRVYEKFEVIDKIPDAELPPELIKQAPGQELLAQENFAIGPLNGWHPDIEKSSIQLIQQGHQELAALRGLNLRQCVNLRSVPVNLCEGDDGGKVFPFWVYGSDRRVHAPLYPSQCCGCCTIM
jgi:hypothetical protein